ncbi:MAG: hypothetical protein GX027_03040 [Clostridiaceae bacterium]|nr:hypothetical protein [Clostridiaceae bacterium]
MMRQSTQDDRNLKEPARDEKTEARKKRWLYLLLVTAAMLALTVLNMSDLFHVGDSSAISGNRNIHIIINEIMAENYTGLADEDGDIGDWIELYNPGNLPVNLFGYSLSDKQNIPGLWIFPDVKIMPGEYLLVWADGKDRVTDAGIHINFRISAGEVITLSNPSGTVVDSVRLDRTIPDTSYGRVSDGTGLSFLAEATPGNSNSDAIPDLTRYFVYVSPPEFSRESGFYSEEFELQLSCSHPNATIRYTLDGSEPTIDSPVYEEPIVIKSRAEEPNVYSAKTGISIYDMPPQKKVFKAAVVRVRAFSSDEAASEIVTHTYFVDGNMAERYKLPVISLVTNPENLFDYFTGIFMKGKVMSDWLKDNPGAAVDGSTPGNYNQRGMAWERGATITFFEPDGTVGFTQNVGIRTFGGWSRSNRHKPLRVIARKRYDQSETIDYPVFPGLTRRGDPNEPLISFKQLLLRSSGNDWEYTMIRDALMQSLVAGLGVDTQSYRPCVLFINGEFWGIYNIREAFDEYFIRDNYNVDLNEIVILEGNSGPDGMDLYYGREEDVKSFNDLIDFARLNDLSVPENYEYVANQIDIDNFIVYHAAQIYFGNTDWPGSNVKVWRKRTNNIEPDSPPGHDGRWRWLLYDTDFGFALYNIHSTVSHKTLEFATEPGGTEWPNPDWSTVLLRSLLTNEEFKTRFITTFVDLLNTRFSPNYVTDRVLEMREVIAPAMQEHLDRWLINGGSMDEWKLKTNALIGFGLDRARFVTRDLRNYFGLESFKISLDMSDESGGAVRLNGADIRIKGSRWNGILIKDIPVTLEAIPGEGYRFAGWETNLGFMEEPVITLVPKTFLEIRVIFEKD